MATHSVQSKSTKSKGISFEDHLPLDHRLNRIYRIGAGLIGVFLLVFGILGVVDHIGFFTTGDNTVAGLNTNGTLSWLSIAAGLLLLVGMVIGGNFASTLNMVMGLLFILSGFVNLALLDTPNNFLAFRIQNVLFTFVVGVVLMTFGMYGRVSSTLPYENPYYRARHPEPSPQERVSVERRELHEWDRPELGGPESGHRQVR
ncbi:DUF4383 domain-containing protein [Streptomyces sp. J2-1]|uniref:DUF4383 domain-containing protein n=1 Tax=Streptomyces corallincola TaxID=2851888 RepID=UPI001C38F7C3|nr:DUF4383 domain-containing protein [Streptomyces corallincola]MBV2353765.1 DUF4383 domain-containing protein [Streptomyces corallincola]